MASTPASSTDPDPATTTALGSARRPQTSGWHADHHSFGQPTSASTRTQGQHALAEIIREQEEIFVRRQPESARLAALAGASLAGGVVSSWQITRPQPVWLSHGKGSKLYDVDGNEYVDLHGGYGVSLAGHGHPAIVAAVRGQVERGTHFAQPTENALVVAADLARRFGLPQWRFTNSGTEATMDAVHLARGVTGRDTLLKIEGSYHGHHDAVMVSVYPPLEALGDRDDPVSVPYGAGMPRAITDLTRSVPFNDADALAAVLG